MVLPLLTSRVVTRWFPLPEGRGSGGRLIRAHRDGFRGALARIGVRREVALRVAVAAIEDAPTLARAPLHELTPVALRAFYARRDDDRLTRLAGRVVHAGDEAAIAPGPDHHRLAACGADFVRRFIRHLLVLRRRAGALQ